MRGFAVATCKVVPAPAPIRDEQHAGCGCVESPNGRVTTHTAKPAQEI